MFASRLTVRCSRCSALDNSALVRSFEKIFCTLEDLKIDCPHAERVVLEIIQGCIEAQCVQQKLLTKLPETLLRAGVANQACLGLNKERLRGV